ncbi:hypothetical protein B4U80_04483 [Leptotrombidium deliense]|uniref:t-SNARE coiled-coil homology domain-containing protein n=1 Tax=Leptotrombidium deliense TaxID=299467 RepID=A0A443SWL6_9ACAR|nr:hypothetical protein B4U80_04483 [Leptotrombidium deliense]
MEGRNTGDPWLVERESVESLAYEIMQKINSRNQQTKHSLAYNRLDTQIQASISSYDSRLFALNDSLVKSSRGFVITKEEVERRQRLLDTLNSKRKQMSMSMSNPNAYASSELMRNSASRHEPGTSSAFNWNDDEETTASRNLTVSDLRQQQQHLVREQDKGLDILGEIISKQKYMAKGISTEIDAQNEILDDIHDTMDQTTDRLIRNTRNIKKVDRKSNTCCYWVIIILLLVAIITVACV